jgi:hypothetical protein
MTKTSFENIFMKSQGYKEPYEGDLVYLLSETVILLHLSEQGFLAPAYPVKGNSLSPKNDSCILKVL